DDTMKDSFTVTGGANGGGSDGGDNGNAGNGGDDGSQLPRTGADLGGLTTGALLLLVGGAAIALTGRKNKFGQTPTSFCSEPGGQPGTTDEGAAQHTLN